MLTNYTKADIEKALYWLWDKDPFRVIAADEDTNGDCKIYENTLEGFQDVVKDNQRVFLDRAWYNPRDHFIFVKEERDAIPDIISFSTLLDSPIDVAGVADSMFRFWSAEELNNFFEGYERTFKGFEIKSCPFCGFSAICLDDFFHHPNTGYRSVRCPMCASRGAPKKSDEEAIEAWNKRFTTSNH